MNHEAQKVLLVRRISIIKQTQNFPAKKEDVLDRYVSPAKQKAAQEGGVTLIFCSMYPEKLSRYISANGCTYDYCLPIVVTAFGTLKDMPEDILERFHPFILGFWWTLLPSLTVYKEDSMPIQVITMNT